MYARSVSFILSIILFVLPLASAAAVRRGGGAPSGSCDPAGIQCCATSEAVCNFFFVSTSAVEEIFFFNNFEIYLGHE